MALTDKQRAWLSAARPLAEREAKRLGISPELILAQAAHESGWGAHAPQNNYFGIKGSGRVQNTQEVINGRAVPVRAAFAAYPDMDAAFKGYGDFLTQNKRYAGLLGSGNDFGANVAQIAKSGYATDPAYGDKLASIGRLIGAAPAQGGGGSAPAGKFQSPARSQDGASPQGDSLIADNAAQGGTPETQAQSGLEGQNSRQNGTDGAAPAQPIKPRDMRQQNQDVMAMLGAKRGSFIFPQFGTNIMKGFG